MSDKCNKCNRPYRSGNDVIDVCGCEAGSSFAAPIWLGAMSKIREASFHGADDPRGCLCCGAVNEIASWMIKCRRMTPEEKAAYEKAFWDAFMEMRETPNAKLTDGSAKTNDV